MSVSSNVLVDANTLRKNSEQKRQIHEYVVSTLRDIGDLIRSAHQEGRKFVIAELPFILDIANMQQEQARREIWSAIIEQLKIKNYRVAINPRKDICLIKITWFTDEDEAEINHQNQIINMHTATI